MNTPPVRVCLVDFSGCAIIETTHRSMMEPYQDIPDEDIYQQEEIKSLELLLKNHRFDPPKRPIISFNDSCNFKFQQVLEISKEIYTPFHVVISQKRNCAFVTCQCDQIYDTEENIRFDVLAFDLDTKKQMFHIQTNEYLTGDMCLDSAENSLIILCDTLYMIKLDIDTRKIVWKINIEKELGLLAHSVCLSGDDIYLSASGRIFIFSIFGKLKKEIHTENELCSTIAKVLNLCFDKDCKYLIAVDTFGSKIHIISKEGKSINCISDVYEMYLPSQLCVDKSNGNIIVGMCGWNGISVFSMDECRLVFYYGKTQGYPEQHEGGFDQPQSVALSAFTGELFVVDYGNKRVQVFR